MSNHRSMKSSVMLYLIIVVILEALLIFTPIEAGTEAFMFVPAVSALLTMLVKRELFTKSAWASLGFHRISWKMLLWSFLIPMLPIALGYGFVWATGMAEFAVPEEFQGRWLLLIISFFMTLIIAGLTVTLGEEFGWRGFLAPRLKQLGLVKALLVGGVIWGLFHVPVMVFTDLYHGDTNLFVYIPLFMITVTLAGSFMAYVRYATGSIWPAIMAHAVHNLVWNFGDAFTQNPSGAVTYITGDAGIVLIAFYLIVFVWIVKKKREQPML